MKVYVAVLEKKASLCTGCFDTPSFGSKDQVSWMSLGHFDAIHTYSLTTNGRNVFTMLRGNNQKIAALNGKEQYYHPLYMLSDRDDADFWSESTPYIGIVRIHFAKTTQINNTFRLLDSEAHKSKSPFFDFRIYRTVDLSDALLAVKSKRLDALISFSSSLHRFGSIEKLYTYCGIRMEHIRNTDWSPDVEDILCWCTMRFSVCSYENITARLNVIRDLTGSSLDHPVFSIVGVDDVALSWHDFSTSRLVALLREWFCSRETDHLLYRNFSDVTTRLGAPFNKSFDADYLPLTDAEREGKKALENACDKLLVKKDAILKKAGGGNVRCSWLKPLSELTLSMSRLSRSVLLDELLYTMIPGVSAFLSHIDDKLPLVSDPMCESFIENWSNILEHIMRTEGQLTHHPELRPILFDFPIIMLEYTLAFVDLVCSVLQNNDSPEKKTNINMLLIPRLGKEKVAYELFAPSDETPCGLLMVSVPFDLLYHPRSLLRALCHEASHYVGESCRNRLKRRELFLQAAARLASHTLFEHQSYSLIKALEARLFIEVPTKAMTMNELEKGSAKVVLDCMCTPERRQALMLDALNRADEDFPFYVINWEPKAEDLSRFQILLTDLCTLFRETFADMCMLHLLPIDTREYISSHEHALESLTDIRKRRNEQVAVRIFISLTASGKSLDACWIHDLSLKAEIEKLQAYMGKKEDRDRLIPISALEQLLNYCKSCHNLMEIRFLGTDYRKVRKMYENVISDKMNYEEFVDCIDQYRLSILDRYS